MFISTATILCLYVHIFSWVILAHGEKGILKAMAKDVLSDFLVVYCFITLWFVGGLTGFHFYLISSNQVVDASKFFNDMCFMLVIRFRHGR